MIKLDKVVKIYKSKSGIETIALNDISIEIPSKGMIFILGKSGCGKSTLLNVLGGLDNINSGDIIINDQNISRSSSSELDSYRSENIGFVFQEYNLIDEYSIFDNIAMPLRFKGCKDIESKVASALAEVDLAGFEKRRSSELSGGQKQRVAIARAIVGEANIILADEPTGNLDSKNATDVFALLKKISERCLVLVVSHDSDSAMQYGDRVIEMSDGVIIRDECIDVPQEECIVELRDETNDVGSVFPHTQKRKRKGIDIASLTRLSVVNMWKKKYRLIATIVLFFFTLTLFGIGIGSLTYDPAEVAMQTYYDEGISEVKVTSYDYTYFSESDYLKLQSSNPNHILHKSYEAYEINRSTEDALPFYNIMAISEQVLTQYDYVLSVGRVPDSYDEICISKYYADDLIYNTSLDGMDSYEDLINTQYSEIVYLGIPLKIVGVVDTDFDGTIARLHETPAQDSLINSDLYASITGSLMVHKDFIDDIYVGSDSIDASYKYLEYSNFPGDMFPPTSVYRQSTFRNISAIERMYENNPCEITYANGINGLSDGEVLVSKEWMQEQARGMFPEVIAVTDEQLAQYLQTMPIIENIEIVDRSGTEQNDDKYIDLKIVGYYEDNVNEFIITDALMDELNYSNGITGFNTAYIDNRNDDKALFNDLLDEKYRLNSYCSRDIETANLNADTFEVFGLFASLAFGVFSIIMMANFITTSINTNKRQIGILRALGMRASGIMYMFILESLIVATSAFILASIAIIPLTMLLTSIASFGYVINVDIFTIGALEICSMLGISLAIATISSIVPIIKKSKTPPVKLIKD